MPLQCNIDRRGRLIRAIYGAALLIAGLILAIFWAWPAGGMLPWTIALILTLGGAFALFEAANAWCILRAIGIRTRF